MNNIVKVIHKPNLNVGEPHQCHCNAAMYAIENDCNFVCGWIAYENSNIRTPHCICEKNGEYFCPTLNRDFDFKVYCTYTAREICDIFNDEGESFIPFMGNGKSVYDGKRKLTEDEIKGWWKYIIETSMS